MTQEIEVDLSKDKKQQKDKSKEVKGLKRMRAGYVSSSGKYEHSVKPEYYCDNCKCHRYSPCGCIKSDKKEKQNDSES